MRSNVTSATWRSSARARTGSRPQPTCTPRNGWTCGSSASRCPSGSATCPTACFCARRGRRSQHLATPDGAYTLDRYRATRARAVLEPGPAGRGSSTTAAGSSATPCPDVDRRHRPRLVDAVGDGFELELEDGETVARAPRRRRRRDRRLRLASPRVFRTLRADARVARRRAPRPELLRRDSGSSSSAAGRARSSRRRCCDEAGAEVEVVVRDPHVTG